MDFFSLQSFRCECFRKLGFDGFFNDFLNDEFNLIAFLLPKTFYESGAYEPLVNYLQQCIQQKKWNCTLHVLESGEYDNNWCGSRFNTHILGPHILIQLDSQYESTSDSDSDIIPTVPTLPNNWSIVSVEYNAMKPANSNIVYYTTRHEAAFPDEYNSIHSQLQKEIRSILASTA